LAASFTGVEDGEKIEQQDRISVTGHKMAPGKPVMVGMKLDGCALLIQADCS
jgi:hypothetical protein